jgi:hypothetical protein
MTRTLAQCYPSSNSTLQIPFFAVNCHHRADMTINDIRRQNLEILILEFRTIRALAEACDVNDAYLSQVRNALGDSRHKTPRNIGDEIARKLETGTHKPHGWLDTPHVASTETSTFMGVKQAETEAYTDPRRRRLILAFEEMTDSQIDDMLNTAELTAKTNCEIEAAMSAKKKHAA